MHRTLATAFLLTAVGSSGPCDSNSSGSSGSSATALPNIDQTLLLTALTTAQQGTLCDWEAAQLGGYGNNTAASCASGDGIAVSANQAQCVAGSAVGSSCTAIVGDVIGCYEVLATSPCRSTELNAVECQPLLGCTQ